MNKIIVNASTYTEAIGLTIPMREVKTIDWWNEYFSYIDIKAVRHKRMLGQTKNRM